MQRILAATVLTVAIAFAGMAIAGGMPKTDGKALWNHLEKNGYTSWDLYPGKGKLYEGGAPHGKFLTTYVNAKALKAIKAGKVTPNGAIIVKENYSPDKKLAAITVMYKVNGYDADAGDWFWAKYQPSGSIDAEGKVGGCIGCHAAAKDNDWVLTSDYVK